MSDKKHDEEKRKVLLILAITVVLSLWLFGGLAMRLFFGKDSGTIGDTFGAVNALFTGFALIGVIVAIYYQRTELIETRKSLDAQKNELVKRNKAANLAQFETTFFGLLKEFRDQIDNIEYRNTGAQKTFCRQGALLALISKLNEIVARDLRTMEIDTFDDLEEKKVFMKSVYDSLYFRGALEQTMGNYFRMLYHIIKFVDDSDLNKSRKKFYTNLARAQLSRAETCMLFYNGLGSAGEGMRPLISKYALLKHLPNPYHGYPLNDLYDPSAYGKT